MQSHEVVASSVTAYIAKLLSRAFGCDLKTVEAWRRPKASDHNPTGTGKANPLDQVERAVRIIHKYDSAGARRWAQYIADVCDELDAERARSGFQSTEERTCKVAALIREHSEAVIALMRADDDQAALKELEEMMDAGRQLEQCLKAEIGKGVN